MRKHLLILLISVLTTFGAFAQVTTGSITGTVRDAKGATLPGATIVATHVPSGSVYSTTTGTTGKYTLPNMRVGGPYTIKITFIGFTPRVITDLAINLGDPLKIDVKLLDASQTLATVNVTGNKNALISSERKGTSTSISQQQLQSLPTISRSFQDFARLTPQAIASRSGTDGSALGITFAGQNNRYNRFTIDGGSANDAFGLTASGTNGGLSNVNPIPFESIQQVQILLAPYDVTQGSFTGGGINAVTKSGTNDVHGSAYFITQNHKFIGKNPITQLEYPITNNTFGASLGAPIVKNKVFIYLNAERVDSKLPIAFDPSQSTSGSRFDVNTLQTLRTFITNKYGYDPGSFTDLNKKQYSTSIFARIDWNINDKNKLTIRHSYVDGSNYVISRSPTSIIFEDAGYYIKNTTNSSVIELNSTISSRSSNVLRLSYNNIQDARSTSPFPNVQIVQSGLTYNFGADFSSSANALSQNNYTLTDNFTLYKNDHTFTFGTTNDFYNTSNVFLQAYNGAYTYNNSASGVDNIASFENGTPVPTQYTLNYDPANVGNKFAAKIHAANLSVYAQDTWTASEKLKLTYGVRVDMPVYFNKPVENVAFNNSPASLGFKNNQTPKSTPLFSPRIGFNYDVNNDAVTQLRGGAGIFTGSSPLVWISNQYGGNGISTIKYTAVPAGLKVNYDPSAPLSGAYIPSTTTVPATEIDITDPNFKVPQIFRANLAVDHKLGIWGLIGTLEGVYTKNINAINYKNLSIGNQTDVSTIGSSTRPWYNFARAYPSANFTDVIELTNTNVGYAYNLTAQIQKPMSNGWTGSVAYTFGESYSLNDGTSSVAYSNWRFADNANGLNNLDEARSNYDPGSRITAYVSKTFKYANNKIATTVGLVYIGQSGQPISYVYSKNVSGDDITSKTGAADLIYIPSAAELNDPAGYLNYKFVDLTATSGGVTTVLRTAAQEWGDFKNFVESQQALKDNEGKVIARNGDRTPWENHFDLKVTQDFSVYKTHKLQISADIFNVGNLLNKNWGWSYGASNQNIAPLVVVGQTKNPTFTFDQTKLNPINGALRPYFLNDYTSRWSGQLTLRYSF